jgi:chromosome segregation ATPase
MFISKSEKEELQQKVLDLSLKLSSIEEMQLAQELRTIKVIKEFEEIEGLSEKIISKITNCDLRAEGLENFFAARYRLYDDVEKDLTSLTKASKNLASNIASLENRFDDFVGMQNANSEKVKDRVRMLDNEQKIKNAKLVSIEKSLEITRGVLFALKNEVAANKKDLHDFRKIAVIREEPVFALVAPEKIAVKAKKISPLKGIKLGPYTKTPEAPWGLKLDGTPRKRPGRPIQTKPETKNEQPLSI